MTLLCILWVENCWACEISRVSEDGGVGFGEGRVKFPLYTWKLGKAATEPPSAAGRDPIHSTDAASRWSHCCKDHFASDSPDSLAWDQVRGAERDRKCSKSRGSGNTTLFL